VQDKYMQQPGCKNTSLVRVQHTEESSWVTVESLSVCSVGRGAGEHNKNFQG
jgi:hypothetical protein